MQSKRLKAGIRRPQFNLIASAENSFESGARLINQSHDDFSVARFITTFDQRDVPVADMFVDHRVALYTQRIDAFRSNSAKKKTRDADRFRIFNRVNRNTGGDASNQTNFAHRIGRHVFHAQTKLKNTWLVLALEQTTFLKCSYMLRNRGLGTDSKMTCDLSVRRLVSMLRQKTRDVVEDFFLTLCARQHLGNLGNS